MNDQQTEQLMAMHTYASILRHRVRLAGKSSEDEEVEAQ